MIPKTQDDKLPSVIDPPFTCMVFGNMFRVNYADDAIVWPLNCKKDVMSCRVGFPCAISQCVPECQLNLLMSESVLEKSLELVLIFRLFTLFSFPDSISKNAFDIPK